MKKYTEGRALIIVIIVMALLLILAPAIVLSSNTEVNQTTRYENQMQAYLYARSGVDSALGWLVDEGFINEDFRDDDQYAGTAYLAGSLSSFSLSASQITGENDISVMITEDSDGIHLSSVGTYNGQSREIDLLLQLTTVGGSGYVMPNIDKAVFAIGQGDSDNPSIILTGSPGIFGDVGANTTGTDSIYFAWSATVDGDLYLHAIDADDVIDSARGQGRQDEQIDGDIYTGQPEWIYPMFSFPEFPSYSTYPDYTITRNSSSFALVSGGDLNISSWLLRESYGLNTLPINGNYEFGDITASGNWTLNLDLGGEDRYIVCDNLDISQGHINLTNRGSLTIYVRDTFNFRGSSTFNTASEGGTIDNLTVFYKGSEMPDIGGNTEFVGSLVTETSGFDIGGSNGIQGHLLIGGDLVTIRGDATLLTRILYAPNAHVSMTGSGKVKGSIVANTIIMTGATTVEYDPTDITTLPPGVLPNPGEPGAGTGGDTTELVTSYYWQ
ncbi:MAG TPA: hypothetical protein PLP30_03015 [Clostridia bacterium]|nr:hypothetical protein [Clostridia bacterium]HRX41597.1 hypothetical protein [Clostridia bacterium]